MGRRRGILIPSRTRRYAPMKNDKQTKGKQGKDLRGSAPIAGQNRTDTKTNAQNPMADPLEARMKREGHDM